MLYNIFDSRHMSNLAADFQKKKTKNVYINSQVSKQRNKKILKNEVAQPYLESCQISMMERFSENTTIKSVIACV